MKKQLFFLGAIFLYRFAFAVSGPAYNWAGSISNSVNGMVKAVKTDVAGNVYVTGYYRGQNVDFDFGSGATTVSSVGGSLDIFLAKYSSAGQLIWVKSIGGADFEEANDLAIDQSGNVWITGYFQDTADFNPTASINNLIAVGGNDIFLAKYDASGNYLWSGAMGGSGDEFASAIAVSPLTGNICITGRFDGSVDFNPANGINQETSAGAHDIFFAVFSTAGVLVGEKRMGSTGEDFGIDVAIDNSGNIFLTGRYAGTVNFNPSGGTNNSTSNGTGDAFLAKYNSAFILQWTISIGGANAVDFGLGVATDSLGNAYVCGYANGTIDFDPSPAAATFTTANNINVVGYVAKYSAGGAYQWANAYGVGGNTTAYNLSLDADANIYVTGYAESVFDADPGAAVYYVQVIGHNPYLLKYSNSGLLDWGYGLQSTGSCLGNAVHIDAADNIYVAGYFNSDIEMDITAISGQLLSTSLTQEGFLVKYSNCDFPAAPIVANDSACLGEVVTLTASGSGTISWYDNSTGNNYLGSGSLNTDALQNQLTVWAQDSTCGPGIRISKTIYIKPMPTVTISPGSTSICLGQEVGLYAAGADSYLWNTSATTTDLLETPSAAGAHTYTVIGTNLYGCSDTASVSVTVNPVPSPNITASATTICKGDSVSLDDLNFTGDDYIWSNGDFEHNITVGPVQSTDYFLSVVNSFSCFAYDTVSIVVNSVDVNVLQNGNVLTSTEIGATYQWISCGTGNPINNATAATYTATANGDYAVVVTGVNGCIDTSACLTVTGVGIEKSTQAALKVYPIPAIDWLTVELPTENRETVIELVNNIGSKLTASYTLQGNKLQLETQTLPEGIYLLHLNNTGIETAVRFIKTK
ncbi:MAG: SBBP repeat-containing protein [Chitinophagales bacterium]